MTSQRVVIAGEAVEVSAADFERYIDDHPLTVRNYDLLPEPRSVGPELIRATRSPYMGSRITAADAEWFVERSRTAPWDEVPWDSSLADADPTQAGGLYDAAVRLYDHFRIEAPKGVAVAKLSKVLHVMRPALVPILDSRLMATCRSAAQDAASRVAQQRPELRSQRRMYWAAIREDLLASQDALSSIRQELRDSDEALVREAAERISDLRLLDMVTWKR